MSDENSTLLRLATNALEEIFFVFTPEGKILEWNRRFNEVTGYTNEEIKKMHPVDFVPDEEEDHIREHIAKALEEGRTRLESHFQTKDGREIPYEFTGSVIEEKGKTLICGTGRDITERKRAEEELEASNRELQRQAEEAKKKAKQIEKKNALLGLTEEVATTANEAKSFEEALQTAVDAVCELTGWPLGHVYMPSLEEPSDKESSEKEPSRLEPTSIWNQGSKNRFEVFRESTAQTTFAQGEGLMGQMLEGGGPRWIEDATEDPTFLRRQAAENVGLKGAFAFPVSLEKEVVAVLEFFSDQAESPDEELLEIMETVGVQLGRVAEREKARQRLTSSVRQYQSLKESAVDAIVVAKSDGRITDWNRGAEEIFGYKKEEIIGEPIEVLMPERHKEPHRKGMERARRTGEGRLLGETVELEGLRKSGEEFPLELSLSSWEVEGERCFSAIIRDITERRRKHRELLRSERRYRRLFEDALEGVIISTPEGKVLAANSAAEDILGYSREELQALKAEELYANPEERKEIAEEIRQRGSVRGRETRLRRSDGKAIICELSVTVQHWESQEPGGEGEPGENREPETWQGLFRDITERKMAEEALRESEEMFRALSEESLVGVALLRKDEYVYVNPAFAQIAGRTSEEIIGTPPESVFHPADRPTVRQRVKERFEEGRKRAHYEARIQTKEGETRIVEIIGSRITYQGEPAIIGTVQDVTEQRRMQREMIRVQEEERKRIGQDLHDGVASQLTGATLKLSTLFSKVQAAEAKEGIQEVQSIIEESASDVRRLSRGLNPGGLSEGDLPSALRGLVQNTEGTRLENLFENEGLLTGEGVEGEVPSTLEGERATHLYRIAQEAVANAKRHGEATVIEIRFGQEDGAFFLEVEDNGKGFNPSETGTEGLGLRSMRNRAELLGADLKLESSPGEGTLVRCRLPI